MVRNARNLLRRFKQNANKLVVYAMLSAVTLWAGISIGASVDEVKSGVQEQRTQIEYARDLAKRSNCVKDAEVVFDDVVGQIIAGALADGPIDPNLGVELERATERLHEIAEGDACPAPKAPA